MTTAAARHTNNTIIGSGEVFLDLIEAGEYTGERYLGDSIGASLTVATERTQVFTGDGPIAKRIVDQVRQVTHSFALTLQDAAAENLAMFIAGTAASHAQAAVAVADETHKVNQGRWYQLGATAANPGGAGAVAAAGFAVSVGDTPAAAVAAAAIAAAGAADHYVLDAERGRVYIVPGSATIADGKYVSIDYAPVAAERETVKFDEARPIEGAFRYVETVDLPGSAKGRNFYARLCSISGSGELSLKSRDTQQQIGITVEVQEPPGDWPALAIDGDAT